jgi:hypothetical protein
MRITVRNRSLAAVLTAGLMVWAFLLPGCQSGQRSTGTGRPCPICGRETRTMPLTGLTYTTCVCPECKKVTTLDAATLEAVQAYTGRDIGGSVEVCTHCQVITERCAACREARGK